MDDSIASKMLNLSSPVLLIVSGMALLTFGSSFIQTQFQGEIVVLSGVMLVITGGAVSAFAYLKGNNRIESSNSSRENLVNITNTFEDDDIQRIVNALKEYIDSILVIPHEAANLNFSAEERKEIIESIKSNITNELAEDLFKSAKIALTDNVTENKYFLELRRELQKTKARLLNEISALTRRGNLNLVIGGVTTILAVSLLGYVVLTANSNTLELKDFVWHYIPRITVSIFIQIFSFFFLRLYKNSLDDIKYFQNELTNIDFRYSAFEAALILGDKAIISKVIEEISITDRNSKLKKGESTVELEKLKAENKSLLEMLGSAKDLISSIRR